MINCHILKAVCRVAPSLLLVCKQNGEIDPFSSVAQDMRVFINSLDESLHFSAISRFHFTVPINRPRVLRMPMANGSSTELDKLQGRGRLSTPGRQRCYERPLG